MPIPQYVILFVLSNKISILFKLFNKLCLIATFIWVKNYQFNILHFTNNLF